MDCLPCQQRARARTGSTRRPWVDVQMPRPPVPRHALGQAPSSSGPSLDVKRDLVAGAVAVAVPVAYDRFAPKKWPKLTLLTSVGAAAAAYFLSVWVYGKVA